ncbi:MAG: type III-A CRISPR-associated protein Csm2 [Gammaproteobacteria bacterium]|nr:MAG: type III-A CRISPR-associated protein Csm2 [Gammaproteobacteria bacterium]RTZ69089.1 MAG: type III-A CRISPR-associated protein Csm2 [Aquificaceae bacterium]
MRYPYKGKPKNNSDGGQKRKDASEIRNFENYLRRLECFSDTDLRELVKPQGYADRLASFLKNHTKGIKTTQLRKFFNEIKSATQKAKSGNWDEAKANLWRIYPIIAYSVARDLMPKEFGEMMNLVLEKVENCPNEEKLKNSFDRLNDFITALYAYFRKYAGG